MENTKLVWAVEAEDQETERLWREKAERMRAWSLDNTYYGFSLLNFLEKVKPLVAELEYEYQLGYEYLKSLKAVQGMEVEAGIHIELVNFHKTGVVYQYLCLLWEGGKAQKFPDVLRELLNMMLRIAREGLKETITS